MKLFTGSLAAGLVLLAAGAQAQVPNGRYTAASDFDAPYAAAPRDFPGPRYGYGPSLLPSTEVYAVLRDNGFSPLGIPRLRGFVYTIAVLDRGGEDGRLVIDARNGRIIRFVPAYRMGGNFFEESRVMQGPPVAPAPDQAGALPQPARSGPKVASRTVPVPRANPLAAKPAAPEPLKQAAAPAARPAEAQAAVPPAAKPAPQLAPTKEMPNIQGLE